MRWWSSATMALGTVGLALACESEQGFELTGNAEPSLSTDATNVGNGGGGTDTTNANPNAATGVSSVDTTGDNGASLGSDDLTPGAQPLGGQSGDDGSFADASMSEDAGAVKIDGGTPIVTDPGTAGPEPGTTNDDQDAGM